ncbi:MAG: PhnD/SsuA/transferrin family substrate-binding protein [Bdellovibrionales bacterium]
MSFSSCPLTNEVLSIKKTALLLSLSLFLIPSFAQAAVNFGVAFNRGELKCREEWAEMIRYLEKEVGEPVTLFPVNIDSAIQAFTDKKVDYLVTNPVIAVVIHEKHRAQPLVSMNTKKGTEFGGVIFANKASGITKPEDMKGKKVMSYTKDSAGAYTFQVYELMKKGINPEKDFASFVIAKKQDSIALAVKAGLFDAGFARTGILEALVKSGAVSMDDFVIVNQVKDAFPEVHSTPLYPEWMILAQEGADPAITQKLKTVLLGVKADSPEAQKAEIQGFVAPLDLAALTTVLKELKAPPFDQ